MLVRKASRFLLRMVRSILEPFGLEIRLIEFAPTYDAARVKSVPSREFLRAVESIPDWATKYKFFESYRIDEAADSFRVKDDTPSNLQGLANILSRNNLSARCRLDTSQRVGVNGFTKIHYACGSNLFESWLNVDMHQMDAPNYRSVDLVATHPFAEDSFEFGFAEDFLEHLSQSDSIIFLSEAYRSLRPGGVLRLSFPGLEGVLRRHYGPGASAWRGAVEAYAVWEHLHFYSVGELELVAKHIGFKEVTIVEFGQSTHEALKALDSRREQIGLNTYVELKK